MIENITSPVENSRYRFVDMPNHLKKQFGFDLIFVRIMKKQT